MHNDRPIEDPHLQRALSEVKAVMARHGVAGAVMLVSADEAAFSYRLHAPWSAFRPDAATPLGFRFRASARLEGAAETERRVEAAVHTVCSLADFGQQTMDWMEQMKLLVRKAGIDFVHKPFDGKPLGSIEKAGL